MTLPPHRSHIVRHSVLLLVVTQVTNVLNLLYQLAMGRTLCSEEFGVLSAMLGLVAVTSTPLDALRMTVAHFTSLLVGSNQSGAVRALLRRALGAMGWVATGVLLVALLGGRELARVFHLESAAPIGLTGGIIAGTAFLPVLAGCHQGAQKFGYLAFMQLAWSVGRTAGGAALVMLWRPIAEGGLGGQLIGVFLCGTIGAWGAYEFVKRQPAVTTAPFGLWKYGAFAVTALAGFSVLMSADVVMVKLFFDPAMAGTFARAAAIGRMAVFFPMPIALALFPKVSSEGYVPAGSARVLAPALLMSAALVLGVVGVITAIPRIPWWLLYGEPQLDAPAARMVRQIVWALAPLGVAYVLLHFELAQRRYSAAVWLVANAMGYVVSVATWHASTAQVILALAVFSTSALLGLLALVAVSLGRERRGRPCVFFDRDGIVNESPGAGYVERVEDFHLLPDFVTALRIVRQRGYEAVIVTNQRGVALGRLTEQTLDAIHAKLRELLAREGLGLLDILVCTADDDSHPDRKPNPGMLLKAAERHGLDLSRSWMIGDNRRDVEAGRRAGCRTVFVGAGEKPEAADYQVESVAALPEFLDKHL